MSNLTAFLLTSHKSSESQKSAKAEDHSDLSVNPRSSRCETPRSDLPGRHIRGVTLQKSVGVTCNGCGSSDVLSRSMFIDPPGALNQGQLLGSGSTGLFEDVKRRRTEATCKWYLY